MSHSRSTSATILLILILVITAPIWLTVGGVLIGVFGGIVGGIFGAIFGIFGGLLGAFFALMALPFKLLFGGFDFFDGDFHLSGKAVFIILLVVLLVASLKRQRQ
jgi:hypothetical protein